MGRGCEVLRSARWRAGAVSAALAICLLAPVAAHSDALPDGRVYEQVSPVTKNGFDAGAPGGSPAYAVAMADGSGLLYGSFGPMGDAHRGLQEYTIGHRTADGWSAVSAMPAGSVDRIFALSHAPYDMVPSADLTKLVFGSYGTYVPDNPDTLNYNTSVALYLTRANGTIDWLTRPQIPNPEPAPGSIPTLSSFQPVGVSPDLSTVYFWGAPTLLPADAAREPFLGTAWGMYEYSGGTLKAAGTLPNGTEPTGGSAPASSGGSFRDSVNLTSPDTTSNQVSRDGSTLLFVSPDPGPNPPSGPLTQLYVRRNGHSTLVSHDANKDPAPSGAAPVAALNGPGTDPSAHQYAYGSKDGKTVIFQSLDALAQGAPSDSSQKAYLYDVDKDTVTYLPNVSGTVVAASDDNQRFLFGDASHIAVWDKGTIKTIASVGGGQLSPARATASGSVFLFSTQAPIPGFHSGGAVQVYRYDVDHDKTTCLSCPPDSVASPRGGSLPSLSNQSSSGELVASRGLSDDGDRVFFQTPDALLPRDTNGTQDVYEWTPSALALISSGRSQNSSFLLDNSANGDDVFIATAEGLGAGDTDGSYDVYDARVGGGFKRADQAAPCTGDACQGDASGAPSVPAPGSGSFSGPGNQEPQDTPEVTPTSKLKLRSRTVANGTLELTATIARPGRVTVSGSGLQTVRKTYTKAGTVKVKVALTASARRTLKGKHRLRLSVRVGFTPQYGAASSVKFVLNAKA